MANASSATSGLFCADFCDYPIMLETAERIDQTGPVIAGGQGPEGPAVLKHTGIATYFDWREYYRSEDIRLSGGPDALLSEHEAAQYDHVRMAFRLSLDRVFLAPPTAAYAEQYFRTLIIAFRQLIKTDSQIKTVVFAHTPHFPWHLVFHAVCKNQGVPVYIMRPTQIANVMLLDSCLSSHTQKPVQPQVPVTKARAMESIYRVSPRLRNSIKINEHAQRSAMRGLSINRFTRLVRSFYRRRAFLRHVHYYRQAWYKLVWLAWQRSRDRKADLAFLQKQACQTPPTGRFVYFALHYQPERTTVPEAGYYYDQLSAIRELAARLPPGCHLAVKEHPRQLGDRTPSLRRLHFGRTALYEAIKNTPHVVLYDPFLESKQFLANAIANATCTGTNVFEGLQHGVPGLTFAVTWHSTCPSAPWVGERGVEDTLRHLIAKPTAEVRKDLEAFIEHHHAHWFVGVNHDQEATLSNAPRDVLITSMAREVRALARAY